MKPQFNPQQKIHFTGIGGTGLSAIARVFLLRGFSVTGSDRYLNQYTQSLEQLGAVVYQGHDERYVQGADLVIVSSAISADHVEVLAANARGIPVYKRADILSGLMDGYRNICVAGAHGKTTTTSMIAHILIESGLNPNYIIGSVLARTGFNADVGSGDIFVIEADEYDNMFHGLRPQIAVITNIEYDHPDFFPAYQEMFNSFASFVDLLPEEGLLVACADDAGARELAIKRSQRGLPVVTYGIDDNGADWRARELVYGTEQSRFDLIISDQPRVNHVTLQVPGRHNILNAMAALIVSRQCGISFEEMVKAIGCFQNSRRRFEVRGNIEGIVVVDDYAHHPTEIQATLQATRQRYPHHEIWAVWQPHTFSRVRELFDAYLCCFQDADHVCVTDIFASREQPVAGVTGERLAQSIDHPDVRYTASFEKTVAVLLEAARSPAVIVIMSAGDAPQIGLEYLAKARDRSG